jgi:hypothetical protein
MLYANDLRQGHGYRQVLARLINDGCIGVPKFGILRLTVADYREAIERTASR